MSNLDLFCIYVLVVRLNVDYIMLNLDCIFDLFEKKRLVAVNVVIDNIFAFKRI